MNRHINNFDANIKSFGKLADITSKVKNESTFGWDDGEPIQENQSIPVLISQLLTNKNFIYMIEQLISSGLDDDVIDSKLREILLDDVSHRTIPAEKLIAAITNPNAVHDLLGNDLNILIEQLVLKGHLTKQQEIFVKSDPSLLASIVGVDSIKSILLSNLNYNPIIPKYKPTITDVHDNGLYEELIGSLKNDTDDLIDENIIHGHIDNYLDDIYKQSIYLTPAKMQQIHDRPSDLLRILNVDELNLFLDPAVNNVGFLDTNTIENLVSNIDTSLDANQFISDSEILAILDKNIDMKTLALRSLSQAEIRQFFDDLIVDFKNADLVAYINTVFEDNITILTDDIIYDWIIDERNRELNKRNEFEAIRNK